MRQSLLLALTRSMATRTFPVGNAVYFLLFFVFVEKIVQLKNCIDCDGRVY